MYDIEMHEPSQEFRRCWQAAGQHIQTQAQGPLQSWLKASLVPPFLEHLSFRLGNQLFFIRIEDVDGRIRGPGNPGGLLTIADGCRGHPCVMPMRLRSGQWAPDERGWGLVHARTGKPVDPPALITDELIEITDWELQDFAVQVVRNELEKEGRRLMSWQGNPHVDPSLWFVGDDEPEWVVVRAVRYPVKDAVPPANMAAIAAECAHLGTRGHFASLSFANINDPFDPAGYGMPLYRGHGCHIRYEGLVPWSQN